jgi:hypothetical protein
MEFFPTPHFSIVGVALGFKTKALTCLSFPQAGSISLQTGLLRVEGRKIFATLSFLPYSTPLFSLLY